METFKQERKKFMPLIILFFVIIIFKLIQQQKYNELEAEILNELGFHNWNIVSYFDDFVTVKSRQEKYDDIKFFKENREKFAKAEQVLKTKKEIANNLNSFLAENNYQNRSQYARVVDQIKTVLKNADAYRIKVKYISSAGNNLGEKEIVLKQHGINKFKKDPALLMGKAEYNKFLKEQQKEVLSQKHHEYYTKVNTVIDFANKCRNSLIIKGS